MKLAEAEEYFNTFVGKTFKELFSEEQLIRIASRRNKGGSGQALELKLGLNLSNTNLDFEDGELKTNKCDLQDRPRETVAISQIASHIDNLINHQPFYDTWLFEKIHNFLYVPIVKMKNSSISLPVEDWYYSKSIHVDFKNEKFKDFYNQVEKDYDYICDEIKNKVENNQMLSTITGEYLQIRTKGANNKSGAIFSPQYNKYISKSSYSFYFTLNGIKALKKIAN